MTKKARNILFLICFLLFLLVAPLVFFYSQGYRFDFYSKKISQTGGLFLKVSPKSVEVYLDGELKNKTDFFFGSLLISNLLPRKYQVQIKKEGYHSWQKNLEIKEKEVTEVKNIVLIPKEPNFRLLEKDINNFYFSPDGKKIIFRTSTQPPSDKEKGWALKLFDLERNVKSHLVGEKDLSKKMAELLNLNFSPNSKEVSLEIGVEEKIKYFTLEIEEIPPLLKEVKELPLSFEEKNLKISPDLKKMIEFNDYEIWVLFLDDDPPTAHREGDRVFIARFSEKLGDVFWYTPYYLLFNTGGQIKIAEIDERDRINIVGLAEFKNPKIFWNQTDKKLYVLSEGNLYVSERLIR